MRHLFKRRVVGVVAGLTMVTVVGCSEDGTPLGAGWDAPATAQAYGGQPYPGPSGVVTAAGFTVYPYTLNHYFAEDQDPVNLIFTGEANPLNLRAALMSLDGDRSGLGAIDPALAPLAAFDCTWQDALGGDEQVAYGADAWAGSVIQLACGDYGPVRFHLRLFPEEGYTIGSAHFEVLIPGTADHRVLNWELAETLVFADFIRTGIAAPVGGTGLITAQPTYRTIEVELFNALPADLKYVVTGDPTYVATEPVGVPNDGNATIVQVFASVPLTPGTAEQQLTLPYAITAPKPICNPDGDKYVTIEGSVDLWQVDILTDAGEYSREFRANGHLLVMPLSPEPGEPQNAIVEQQQFAKFWPGMASTSRRFTQTMVPVASDEGGRATMFLQWGPNGRTNFDASEKCGM